MIVFLHLLLEFEFWSLNPDFEIICFENASHAHETRIFVIQKLSSGHTHLLTLMWRTPRLIVATEILVGLTMG